VNFDIDFILANPHGFAMPKSTTGLSTTFLGDCIDGELWFTYTIHMNKSDTIKTMQIELQRLNQDIDLKIIKGHSYHREARRHRFLTVQLARLTARENGGWLRRMSRAMTMF